MTYHATSGDAKPEYKIGIRCDADDWDEIPVDKFLVFNNERVTCKNYNQLHTSNKELDRTSVIMEALAVETKNWVYEPYYELALKSRYTRDDNGRSAEMLDLMLETRTIDLGDTIWQGFSRNSFLLMKTKPSLSTASSICSGNATTALLPPQMPARNRLTRRLPPKSKESRNTISNLTVPRLSA